MSKKKDDADDVVFDEGEESETDDDEEVQHPVRVIITKLEESWLDGGERIDSVEAIAWIVLNVCKVVQTAPKEQNPLKSAPEFGRMPKWDALPGQIAAIAAFLKSPNACRSNEPIITALQRGDNGGA